MTFSNIYSWIEALYEMPKVFLTYEHNGKNVCGLDIFNIPWTPLALVPQSHCRVMHLPEVKAGECLFEASPNKGVISSY